MEPCHTYINSPSIQCRRRDDITAVSANPSASTPTRAAAALIQVHEPCTNTSPKQVEDGDADGHGYAEFLTVGNSQPFSQRDCRDTIAVTLAEHDAYDDSSDEWNGH